MADELRFAGHLSMPRLEQIYRDRYRGEEHNILFQPHSENVIALDIRVKVPHVVASNEAACAAFNACFQRLLRRTSVECIQAAMEAMPDAEGVT